jgi:hypothetical protein
MGVIVALCAELYFMPRQAFITRAQINTEIFIRDVGQGIDRMSAKPEMLK